MTHRAQLPTPIGWLTIEANEDAVTHIALPRDDYGHSTGNGGPATGPTDSGGKGAPHPETGGP